MTTIQAARQAGTLPKAAGGVARQLFDLDGAWMLHPAVSVRPEPFGALLYHFGNRRLSFLKTRQLLEIVQALGHSASARDACESTGVAPEQLGTVAAALASLQAGEAIIRRDDQSQIVGRDDQSQIVGRDDQPEKVDR